VAILLSLSRGGAISAIASILVIGAVATARQAVGGRRWLAILGLAILLAVAFVFLIPTGLVERFGSLAAEESTEGRPPIWKDTASLIGAYPLFGVGYGNFYPAISRYLTSGLGLAWTAAHNDYLQLASELGLLGFSLVVIVVGGSLARAVRAALARERPGGPLDPWDNTRYVGLACTGSLTAFLLHSIVDFNAYVLANALTLAWVAGVAASLPVARPQDDAPHAARRRFTTWGTGPFVLAGGVLLTAYATAWLIFLSSYGQSPSLEAERAFCRYGVCDTDAVLATLLGPERDTDPRPVPVDVLVSFLHRDPASPERWVELGEGLQLAGRTPEARRAFSRAVALAPHEPSTLLRAADFYMEVGERPRGLALVSHTLQAGDIADDGVFGEIAYRRCRPTRCSRTSSWTSARRRCTSAR
jgi:hypothetical protein